MITGARAPVALELARAFKSSGCRVVVADTFPLALARWSRSADAYVRLPAPATDHKGFVVALRQAVRSFEVDDVIPTCEETFFVAMAREQLPCRVWTTDVDTLRMFHDKLTFARTVQNDMYVPETVSVSTFTDWKNSADYVFKPRFSRFAARTLIGRQVHATDIPDPEAWVAQRRIIGKEYCVYSVWQHGAMTAIAIYHPRFRAGQGAGIFLEAVRNDEIMRMVMRTGTRHQWHGQCSFDVIVDAETQTPYVIECNPRATSGAHLLADVARAFDVGLWSQEGRLLQPSPTASCAIWYAMALYHPQVLLQRRYRKAPDAVYQPADPLPAIMQGLSALYFVASAWRNRCTVLEATTLDIEWNG